MASELMNCVVKNNNVYIKKFNTQEEYRLYIAYLTMHFDEYNYVIRTAKMINEHYVCLFQDECSEEFSYIIVSVSYDNITEKYIMTIHKEILNPGSENSLKYGCMCPVLDNHNGKGFFYGKELCFNVNGDCPIHGFNANN